MNFYIVNNRKLDEEIKYLTAINIYTNLFDFLIHLIE